MWFIGGLIGVAGFALVLSLSKVGEGESGMVAATSTVAESVGQEADSTTTPALTPSSTTSGSPDAPQTSSSQAPESATAIASPTTTPSPSTTLATTTTCLAWFGLLLPASRIGR